MLLVLLAACLDHVSQVVELDVNLPRKRIVADVTLRDVSPSGGPPPANLDEAVHRLVDERDSVATKYAGAEALTVAYHLHDAVLDLVVHAEGPLTYWAADHGDNFRVGARLSPSERAAGGAGRPLLAVWFETSPKLNLAVTTSGPVEITRFAGEEDGAGAEVLTVRRGHAHLRAESTPTDATPSGWVGALPGLEAAMQEAGLL